MKIDFNKAYANKVSKAQWLKDHDHLKEETDLNADWESLQDKTEEDKPKGKAPKQTTD